MCKIKGLIQNNFSCLEVHLKTLLLCQFRREVFWKDFGENSNVFNIFNVKLSENNRKKENELIFLKFDKEKSTNHGRVTEK